MNRVGEFLVGISIATFCLLLLALFYAHRLLLQLQKSLTQRFTNRNRE
jgi:hypothetical protein